MLTPQQVTELRTSAGLTATPPDAGASSIIAKRQSALGLNQPKTASSPDNPQNLGDFTAQAQKEGMSKITSSIKGGADKIQQGTEQGGFGGLGKVLTGVGESALGTASGALSTIFAPVTGAINDTASHLSDIPLIQKIATSGFGDAIAKGGDAFNSWATAHPELATNLSDALNVGLAALGSKVAPEVKIGDLKTTIGDTANSIKTGIENVKNVTGKVTDVVGNKVSDIVSKVKETPVEKLSKLADATAGVMDKKSNISSLEQTGALDKNGKPIGGTKQTLLGGIKTEQTGADLARAKDVQGIINVKKSPVDNLTNLNKEISRISEKEITPALEKAGATTAISKEAPGWNTTVQRLNDLEKPDIIKADATLDKTYDLVRQRMIEQIQKQPATVKGLWDARKAFDSVVKDQFGDVAFDSEKNTAIKRAISDMRRTVNNIIADRVPEFKPQMSKLSNLYDARYNIAEQYQGLVNKGGIKAFKALNPKKAALLKWGVGVAGYETLKHTVAPFLPGI